jgi:hypothetical protein
VLLVENYDCGADLHLLKLRSEWASLLIVRFNAEIRKQKRRLMA